MRPRVLNLENYYINYTAAMDRSVLILSEGTIDIYRFLKRTLVSVTHDYLNPFNHYVKEAKELITWKYGG